MTGAAGGIGTSLRKLLPPIYPDLVLSDLKAPADLGKTEALVKAQGSHVGGTHFEEEGVCTVLFRALAKPSQEISPEPLPLDVESGTFRPQDTMAGLFAAGPGVQPSMPSCAGRQKPD